MATYEILAGLPPYGPAAESFSATGLGKHREGYVVRFSTKDGEWVGNFQPGLTKYSVVVQHPNGKCLIVVSGGHAYIVDVERRACATTFGGMITFHQAVPDAALVVFGDPMQFFAVGTGGIAWRSRRVSWDGIRDVKVEGSKLSGLAWRFDDSWIPFMLDLGDGSVDGGSYSAPDEFRNQ